MAAQHVQGRNTALGFFDNDVADELVGMEAAAAVGEDEVVVMVVVATAMISSLALCTTLASSLAAFVKVG